MGNELVETIKMGPKDELLKILPTGSVHDISLIPCILQVFNDCFRNSQYNLILDLSKIDGLSPALIALLFEITAKARRNGGDVEIINMNEKANKTLNAFSPLDYLSLGSETHIPEDLNTTESVSLNDFFSEHQLQNEDENSNNGGSHTIMTDTIQVQSKPDLIYKACDFVTSNASHAGFASSETAKMKIAVYEACLNVIEHAYRSDPNQWIKVTIQYDSQRFVIAIEDKGQSFEKNNPETYNVVEAANQRKTGGMGLYIIKSSMDEVSYTTDPVLGNRLILVKNIIPGTKPNQSLEIKNKGNKHAD